MGIPLKLMNGFKLNFFFADWPQIFSYEIDMSLFLCVCISEFQERCNGYYVCDQLRCPYSVPPLKIVNAVT